jgi:ABC-type multidrug transport system fused ATPase/permease subunit
MEGDEVRGERFWKVIRTIFASAWKRFPGLIVLAFFLALVTGLMAALVPKLLQQIIDLLIKDPHTSAVAFRNLVLLMAGAALLGVLAGYFTSKITFYIATQTEDFWRFRVLKHFYMLPLQWHDQQDSGEVGGKIDRGGSAIYIIINDLFGNDLFIAFVTLVVVLVAALIAAPSFWWIFLLPVPVYILMTYFMGEKMAKGQDEINKLADDAGRSLYDGISNVRSVKAFGKENEETCRYERKWTAFHLREYALERINFTRTSIQSVLEIGLRVMLIILSFYAIAQGTMSVGTMVMLITYQGMIFGPLGQLNSVFTRMRRVVRRGAGLFDIINEDDLLADAPHAKEIGPLRHGVTLKDVTFHYAGEARGAASEGKARIPAVSRMSFTIKQGTTTALVGRSGSGKSTLTLLMLRFYDPSQGSILWDGTDLRNATRKSLRRQIAIVPQDTSLFNRTIRENIAYGRQDAALDDIIAAAKRAHAHDFIMRMPKGYDSVIGERGVRLSGGQRQRIAIARALLLEPSLLILDESTSHLDSESEGAIQESITDLHHKTTQLIIAHRLSTVMHADQIIVLDKGKAVASGTHDELLESCDIYRKLHRLQFAKPLHH